MLLLLTPLQVRRGGVAELYPLSSDGGRGAAKGRGEGVNAGEGRQGDEGRQLIPQIKVI